MIAVQSPGEIRLTVAIGTAIVVQTAFALIWAGAAGERLTQLEQRTDNSVILTERTARLEEQVIHMRSTLDRIENKLDQQEEDK